MRAKKSGVVWSMSLMVLLAFAACAKGLSGQSGGRVSNPAIPALDSAWPVVNLNVLVLDGNGAPRKIDETKVQLFVDGAEQPIEFRGSPDSPVSLALMIDSSGSIFKQKPAIVSAVTAIVKGMPAGSEVMGVLFADNAYIDLPFTPDSKIDFSFLNHLQARGPTGLFDAVYATESYIVVHAKYPRRALVILSDGEDNASHVSIRNDFWKMEQPGAPVVYACPVSKAGILENEKIAGIMNMKYLARAGGGAEVNLGPDAGSAAERIAAAIRSQYVLQFTAANQARNGKRHKLSVRLPSKDVHIHALPDFYAPVK